MLHLLQPHVRSAYHVPQLGQFLGYERASGVAATLSSCSVDCTAWHVPSSNFRPPRPQFILAPFSVLAAPLFSSSDSFRVSQLDPQDTPALVATPWHACICSRPLDGPKSPFQDLPCTCKRLNFQTSRPKQPRDPPRPKDAFLFPILGSCIG